MNTLTARQQEQQLGHLVRLALDDACRQLPKDVSSRLSQASQLALDHQKVPAAGLRLAGRGFAVEGLGRPLRSAFAVLALIMGMAGAWYWNAVQNAEDAGDVDTALLSDDLPVAAYTDAGFSAWLEHNGNTDN